MKYVHFSQKASTFPTNTQEENHRPRVKQTVSNLRLLGLGFYGAPFMTYLHGPPLTHRTPLSYFTPNQ